MSGKTLNLKLMLKNLSNYKRKLNLKVFKDLKLKI